MDQEAAVRHLLDKDAIREVLYKFSRAVDRMDRPLYESIYHPDATFQTFGTDKVRPAMETIDDAFATVPERYERMHHSFGTILIELEGDCAYTEAYFSHGFILREREDGQQVMRVVNGRYVDRFERRSDEWRIAHRTMVLEYSYIRSLGDAPEHPLSPYGTGDPAYRHNGG